MQVLLLRLLRWCTGLDADGESLCVERPGYRRIHVINKTQNYYDRSNPTQSNHIWLTAHCISSQHQQKSRTTKTDLIPNKSISLTSDNFLFSGEKGHFLYRFLAWSFWCTNGMFWNNFTELYCNLESSIRFAFVQEYL